MSIKRLIVLLSVIALALILGTCGDGLRIGKNEDVRLSLDGHTIIHHYDTSSKIFIFPIGKNIYYEGGQTVYDAGGTSFFLPQKPEKDAAGNDVYYTNELVYIPLGNMITRLYGNGLVYGATVWNRTGNDPSAKLDLRTAATNPVPGKTGVWAVLILCGNFLILNNDMTTTSVIEVPAGTQGSFAVQNVKLNTGYGNSNRGNDKIVTYPTKYFMPDVQVEYELKPIYQNGQWYVNHWGLMNWLPCNILAEFSDGKPSPVHGFPSEARDNAYVSILSTHEEIPPSKVPSPDGITMSNINSQPKNFYTTQRAFDIADNLLKYQRPSGGWYKNFDMVNESDLYNVEEDQTADYLNSNYSTLDNDATHVQLQYLARIISMGAKDPKYKAAFFRGLAFVLRAQYESGGWPQYAEPLRPGYYSEITFNDDAIQETMNLLEDIYQQEWQMGFVWKDREAIKAVTEARNKGLECIIRAQRKTKGDPSRGIPGGEWATWCQQHNPTTLQPAQGRAYELPVLTAMESATVVEYLMRLPNPGPRVRRSIEGAMAWYKRVAMVGYYTERIYDQRMLMGNVREIFYNGNPSNRVWARFYEVESGTEALYTCRDGKRRWYFHETPQLNRAGYQYVSNRPNYLFELYEEWRNRKPDTSFPLDNGVPDLEWPGMPQLDTDGTDFRRP